MDRYRGAILSWMSLPVSVGVFLFLLPGLIAVSYHPQAPGIHLIPVRIALAAVAIVLCVALAWRHSAPARRARVRRNALELGAVPVLLWLAFQAYAAAFPQSPALRKVYRGDVYAIPREYRPVGPGQAAGGYDYITVNLCLKTGAPIYAQDCSAVSSVELGDRPITDGFNASFALHEAGATYTADVIADRGKGARDNADGSFGYDQGASRTRFLLDDAGRVIRFAHCYKVTGTCEVTVRTDAGMLRFPTRAGDSGSATFWRAEEARWTDTFADWKCAEPSCDGQFDTR